jgi:GR25 family glycosyltransferase involved in LPS biosynthesis
MLLIINIFYKMSESTYKIINYEFIEKDNKELHKTVFKKKYTLNTIKIFVVHYKKLIERKNYILEQFKRHNITNYEFIEIDRDELHEQNITMFETNYSTSQIAIALSHFYAYKQISNNYEQGLIFEDDIILADNFTTLFNNYLEQLPNSYDMLFIGDGCNLHMDNIIKNKNVYEKNNYPKNCNGKYINAYEGCTRCTDSYLISNRCAKQLCNYIDILPYKINIPVDWWLNVASRYNNFKVYWAEPTIVTQGTQNGLFSSSH